MQATRHRKFPERMKKLVFISNMPAPYQVKFCYALNEYFDTQFWFYEPVANRGDFWQVPLGDKCRIIPHVTQPLGGRYYTRTHIAWLEAFNPDIVMLGGFSIPANYLAYRWAKQHGKKIIMATEVSRTEAGVLRGDGMGWKLLRRIYSGIDAVFALTEDTYTQFKSVLGFGDKVIQARYASDLDACLQHPLRSADKPPETILFANRLTDIYNPLAAIRIFQKVHQQFPHTRMHMNASGGLRDACEKLLRQLQLTQAVSFLDKVHSWETLHEVYAASDILLLPATFSNGNFTIYEAMASGMGIVISNKILGNGRKVVNGKNGFNLPHDDEELFAQKLIAYIQNPQLMHEHAVYNRQLVQPLGMKGTAALYRDLLSSI
jgi:glycosyltransferase involved in cell wall biosynthesis